MTSSAIPTRSSTWSSWIAGLGLLSDPKMSSHSQQVDDWATDRLRAGDRLAVPEIADYEVRRELMRADKKLGIARLDKLCAGCLYLPLNTPVMHDAASLWAAARNAGRTTARPHALDCDVILAAQARSAQAAYGRETVVVTTNVEHLSRYTDARLWSDI